MHQFGSEVVPTIELPRRPTAFYGEVLVLPPAEMTQLLQEHPVLFPSWASRWRSGQEYAESRHFLCRLDAARRRRYKQGKNEAPDGSAPHDRLPGSIRSEWATSVGRASGGVNQAVEK